MAWGDRQARIGAASALREVLLGAVFPDGIPAPAERALAVCQVHWREIAGDLAEHSQPVRVLAERLVVECAHPVFGQELLLRSTELLAGIRALSDCGFIRSLQIRAVRTENVKVSS